jgi:O-acetyl-ADP-ribose deacetylase (regulator of RNase III)
MTGSVRVRTGDLAASDAAAVVRSVRADGEAITAVGRRLEQLAGPAVAQRLRGLGDLPVGGAVITPAGALPTQFLIHAVLQSAEEPVSTHAVQRALVNALRRARDLGLASVAFPPIGGGAGNLDAEVAAELLVEVLTVHLQDGDAPRSFEIFVDSAYEEELYQRRISAKHLAGDVL